MRKLFTLILICIFTFNIFPIGSREFSNFTPNRRITIDSDSSINDIWAGGGTCMAWINADNLGQFSRGRIFDKKSLDGWSLLLIVTDTVEFRQSATGTNGRWTADNSVLSLNTWVNICVIHDDDTITNDPTIYIDGVSVGVNDTFVPTGSFENGALNDLFVGVREDSIRQFDGEIAHLQLWNRAISVAEINHAMWKPGSIVDGLALFSPLRGDSPEPDLSANSNTGSVTNGLNSDSAPPVFFTGGS